LKNIQTARAAPPTSKIASQLVPRLTGAASRSNRTGAAIRRVVFRAPLVAMVNPAVGGRARRTSRRRTGPIYRRDEIQLRDGEPPLRRQRETDRERSYAFQRDGTNTQRCRSPAPDDAESRARNYPRLNELPALFRDSHRSRKSIATGHPKPHREHRNAETNQTLSVSSSANAPPPTNRPRTPAG